MGVVHGEDGLLGQRGDPVGEFGVADLLRALACGDGWLDHLGVPPGGLRLGDPAGAVALDAEQTLDGGRPESLGDWSSMNGTIAISSSRSRSSGDGCAMPIASRMTISSSSGIPVRSLTCWNVSGARAENRS